MLYEDLKAIYSYSKQLVTGSVIDTQQNGILGPTLMNSSIDDWNKLTNFAYFYLTLFTADE